MKAKHIVFLMILPALLACGQNNKQTAEENSIELLENNLKNVDTRAKGGNKCLLAYAEKYDELLSPASIAEAVDASTEMMKTAYQKVAKQVNYHDITYSWKGTLTKTFGGMTFPMDDYVKLTGIEAISLYSFQSSYRAVSAEENRKLQDDMSKALDGKTENSTINRAVEKLDEMGISKEEQQKMVKVLTESAQKVTKGFSKVDKLGDAAVWNSKTHSLYVLKNGVKFELVVELSDSERNQETAIKLAEMILEQCK
jgi:hypothetical protein